MQQDTSQSSAVPRKLSFTTPSNVSAKKHKTQISAPAKRVKLENSNKAGPTATASKGKKPVASGTQKTPGSRGTAKILPKVREHGTKQ